MKQKLLILIIGCILGILISNYKEYLVDGQFIRDHFHFREVINSKSEIIQSKDVLVLFTFGQSNSANYGDGSYVAKNNVLNYYKGNLYHAKEPLLGPDGKGSSVWTRLGDIMIDSGMCETVIIIPIGIGGTSIQSWLSGKPREKLNEVFGYLKEDGLKPTHIFWIQGETDNVDKTTKVQYKSRLKQLISLFRKANIDAPFYTTITSYFPYNNNNYLGVDKEIAGAQLEISKELRGVKEGPNTDLLNLAYYRADAIHLTKTGLDKLAKEWYKKIKLDHSLSKRLKVY